MKRVMVLCLVFLGCPDTSDVGTEICCPPSNPVWFGVEAEQCTFLPSFFQCCTFRFVDDGCSVRSCSINCNFDRNTLPHPCFPIPDDRGNVNEVLVGESDKIVLGLIRKHYSKYDLSVILGVDYVSF